MSKQIRFGVVGYGRRGQNLFKLAVESFQDVMPAAICESNEDNLSNVPQDFPMQSLNCPGKAGEALLHGGRIYP